MSRVPLLAPSSVDVDVEHFERVMASDRVALLRVAGRWKLAPGERPPVPLLLGDDGHRRTRYAPLPQPLDRVEWIHADSRLWWAGYAIPSEVVLDPRMRWYLDVPRRLRFELPEPEERALLEIAESAGVVVRNGRPYLLLACGLAAAALIPLGAPAHASAADPAPGTPGGPPLHRPAPIVVSATPLTGQAPADTTTAASTTPTPGTTTTTTTTTQSSQDTAGASPPTDTGTTGQGSPPTPGTPQNPPAQPRPHDPTEQKPPRPDPTEHKPRGPHEHPPPPHHHKPAHHREHRHPHHPHSRTRAVHVAPAPAPRAPVVSAPTPTVTPTPVPAFTPQPGAVSSVPDTLLGRFQVPPFLLPIYQAAGTQYGIPWEVLASINEVETNFGRDLAISSAGAEGWMQFLPSTWATWGVDANLDGIRDPNNPADAIFAAARYLAAAGGAQNIRQAIFAYNHAWWYVDKVMAGAQLLDRVPVPVVDAITGLTQGLFPVPGRRVTYARAGGGWRAAASLTVAGASGDPGAVIHAPRDSEAVAVADGRIVATGHNRGGDWVVLEDAFGNRFTYGGLGRVARTYPVAHPSADPPPAPAAAAPAADPPVKVRLFAHPERAADRRASRPLDPVATRSALDAAARQIGLDPSQVVLRPLKKGARVTAGTIVGTVRTDAKHPKQGTMVFRVRAGGPRGPMVDPTPLLDGWRLHQRTEALAPNLALWRKRELKRLRRLGPGKTSTRTQPRPRLGIGQMLLLSKGDLARQVLGDRRVHLLPADRVKIRGGAMDRRVLTALEYLADSGLRPAAGRADGVAVDVVKLGGARLRDRQGPGTPAADAVHRLMRLQGPARPRRIISRVPAHGDRETKMVEARRNDRVAIAYRPDAHGTNAGRDTSAVLHGGSWNGVSVPLPGAAPVDLANAPAIVSTMVSAADQIAGLPYVWGGGHASWVSSGYDCSGSVSYILHAAGLLNAPLVSGELASWGDPGPGRYVTIYANASHTFMEIGGRFYGTSGFAHLPTTGPDWFRVTPPASYLAGFAVRHPPGL